MPQSQQHWIRASSFRGKAKWHSSSFVELVQVRQERAGCTSDTETTTEELTGGAESLVIGFLEGRSAFILDSGKGNDVGRVISFFCVSVTSPGPETDETCGSSV